MRIVDAIRAVSYREVVWIKRYISEYIVVWIMPSFFALSMIFLPSVIGNLAETINRFSIIVGIPLDLRRALIVSFSISGIMAVTGVVINDVINTLFSEIKIMDVTPVILESVSMKNYLIATSIVRPIIMSFASTLYIAIALTAIDGVNGLLTYLFLEIAIIISSITLGLYSMIFAIILVFFSNIRRPWTVSNSLAPAILAGSGLYIPISMVPNILRIFSYTTPLPEINIIVKALATIGISSRLLTSFIIITILFVLYISLIRVMSHHVDIGVRR